jgi:hypothetical protein
MRNGICRDAFLGFAYVGRELHLGNDVGHLNTITGHDMCD